MSAPSRPTRSPGPDRSTNEPIPEESAQADSAVGRWAARLRPRLADARDILAFAVRRSADVRLSERAGSLTFTTVLSIVPLLAVVLAFFTGFPRFAEYRLALEESLIGSLIPAAIARQLLRYINEFALNSARIGALGLLGLVVTAVLLIMTIEHALNDIWQVRRRRPLARRAIVYWALMTLGPLLVGASLTLTEGIAELPWIGSTLGGWLQRGSDLVSLCVLALAMAAIYVYVPNRRVLWRDAIVGGLVAAAGAAVLKGGFAYYVARAPAETLYGAFAFVPLFLMWTYVAWWITLFGAVIAETLPRIHTTRFADDQRAGNQFVTAVALLHALYSALARGADQGKVAVEELAEQVHMYSADVEELLGELESLGYVAPLAGSCEGEWLLTCDPATTGLGAVLARFAFDPSNSLITEDEESLGPWADAVFESEWMRRPLAEIFGPKPKRAGVAG